MEQETRRIALYKTRTFSEKIGDTFDFLRENWRQLAVWLTYLMLPLSLVSAVSMNTMMGTYLSVFSSAGSGELSTADALSTSLSYLAVMVLSFLAVAMGLSLTYGAMRLYEQRPQRLQGLTLSDLRPYITQGVGRMFVLTLLASILLVMLVVVLVFFGVGFAMAAPRVGIFMLVLLYAAIPVVMVPLTLTAPVYLFEDDINPFQAYLKAWRLGWATWGGVAAVLSVLGVLVYLIIGVCSIPLSGTWIYRILTLSRGEEMVQPGMLASMGQYLLSVVVGYIGHMLSVIVYVGLAYQYGHACDKIDGAGIDREIEDFEQL